MNFGYIVTRFADDPIHFAFAIAILIIALALFIKIAGDPISYLASLLKHIAPFALKELRGDAGKAGIVNIIIVICVACLAFVVLVKPSITGLFNEESETNYIFSFIIFLLTIVSFLISLKLVADNEKFTKLYSKNK